MPYTMKPLSCDPARIKGMSERLIISHYENNYGGAVKRLNLIDEQLAQLEFDKAASFLINGLKREQLIALNSMILHELFFDGLGEQSEPRAALLEAIVRDFGSFERWRAEFVAMGKALGGGSGWCCCRGRRAIASWSISGQPIIATRWLAASLSAEIHVIGVFVHIERQDWRARWQNVENRFQVLNNSGPR
jgi:superoxide dismutase, Fe-Mn family